MARVVAALDGGDSLDNEIYAQKCAAALEALEAELADQDRRFATIRETLSLTAESSRRCPARRTRRCRRTSSLLDEKTDGLGPAPRAEREAAVDDLIAAARAEAAVAGVGGLELEDDDGGAPPRAAGAELDRKTTHVIVDEVLGACPHAGEVAALDEIATVAGEPLDVDGAGDDAATFAAVLERIQRAPRPLAVGFYRRAARYLQANVAAAGAAGRDSPFNAAGALGGVLTTCLPAGPSLL
ncbi:hypothetical protein JL720_14163 [Aureococcus anophagefferens]|nr:hypothetical protein JL720_14163 [Aureococcus anophagefferens]